jgi:L-fucose isomerase-like protein
MKDKITLGVIVGNRGFFPGHLIDQGRLAILKVLQEEGIEAVMLSPEETPHGGVGTLNEALKCADLLKAHRDEIDGILVTLPNFGDEKSVADAIRMSELRVPVLVHAFDDDLTKMDNMYRRDSFCGKISVCNNLNQYGIKYSLTTLHTVDPTDESFRIDLRQFAATCRVVGGLKNIRIGALGARPAAFTTVRYSEKLLELAGISVDTLDLSEAFGRASRLAETDPDVRHKVEEIQEYANTQKVPLASLTKMARMAVVIDRWMAENYLVATAIQCWTSFEQFYGITPCSVMSMLSNKLFPSACETDITGVISMYAMALASGRPSALLDWNNNFGKERNKVVVFHCSNLPKDIFEEVPTMGFSEIFAADVGRENAYGTLSGRIKPQPFTYCRVSTDDSNGKIKAYLGEGRFTDDRLETFGGFGVAEVPELQKLIKYVCLNNFEHHVAVNPGIVANAVEDAFKTYMGWDIYRHS